LTRDFSGGHASASGLYSEPSDRIIKLLEQIGEELRHDPAYADQIVSEVQIPGIDRVGNGEVEYLMLLKTEPNQQFAVSRELRRRIKGSFEKNKIQTALPGRVYVMEQGGAKAG
jgi:small-conductance mechanosensitive channel